MQAAVDNPVVLPYNPAAQFVHAPAVDKLYFPIGQTFCVEDVVPGGQKYPAVHTPLHVEEVNPVDEP